MVLIGAKPNPDAVSAKKEPYGDHNSTDRSPQGSGPGEENGLQQGGVRLTTSLHGLKKVGEGDAGDGLK